MVGPGGVRRRVVLSDAGLGVVGALLVVVGVGFNLTQLVELRIGELFLAWHDRIILLIEHNKLPPASML